MAKLSERRVRIMWRLEVLRAILMEPLFATMNATGVVIVVALQHYHASDWQKALLAAATTVGMLLGPFGMQLSSRLGFRLSRAVATLYLLAVPGLLLAAFADSFLVFCVALFSSLPLVSASVPLITALWRQNVDSARRGRLFSQVIIIGSLASVAVNQLISMYLGDDVGRFPAVFVTLACMVAAAAFIVWRIPSKPAQRTGRNPLACLAHLWRHPLFGYMSLVWYLMGLTNLATMPLRVEYLGAAAGLAYGPGKILLLTVVVPQAFRLIAIFFWGRLFDRVNFLILRIAINVFFVASYLLFFWPWLPLQVAGSICYGIAIGGGSVAWALWVTKFSTPERTGEYMAVHTFLTGTRGFIGPQLAYWLLAIYGIHTVASGAAVTMLLATLLLFPVISFGRVGGRGLRAGGE